MRFKHRSDSPLNKKARRGFAGYPVATVAFYGPDDQRASKVAVGIVMQEDAEPIAVQRWFSDEQDLRRDSVTAAEILQFIRDHAAKSVIMADRILGCPHEEGIDYPEGQICPQCLFWGHRDRFTGEVIQ